MRRFSFMVLTLALLSGCETINGAMVRRQHMEWGLGRKVNHQIREGLERREAAPRATTPEFPAPAFMDQG